MIRGYHLTRTEIDTAGIACSPSSELPASTEGYFALRSAARTYTVADPHHSTLPQDLPLQADQRRCRRERASLVAGRICGEWL